MVGCIYIYIGMWIVGVLKLFCQVFMDIYMRVRLCGSIYNTKIPFLRVNKHIFYLYQNVLSFKPLFDNKIQIYFYVRVFKLFRTYIFNRTCHFRCVKDLGFILLHTSIYRYSYMYEVFHIMKLTEFLFVLNKKNRR